MLSSVYSNSILTIYYGTEQNLFQRKNKVTFKYILQEYIVFGQVDERGVNIT